MRKLVLLVTLVGMRPVLAQPLDPKDAPDPLKPWVNWVLRGHEEERCPPVVRGHALAPECLWPARLELEVTPTGGIFRLQAHRYAPGFVALPGSERLWPVGVHLSGRPAPVLLREGTPMVETPAGAISVDGAFLWDSPPAAVLLPPGTALVRLTVNGAPIPAPELDSEGHLLLSRPATAAENERLEIQVQRKLIDGVPMRIETRLVLEVAGRPREELLARALPDGFEPLALEAPLPARLEPDGRLRVQVRPGRWVLSVSGRRAAPTTSVTRAVPEGPWAEGDEIWVFQANPALRLVVVEGLPSVDPSQTQLPPEWRSLPAYAVRGGETMRLVVRRRGDADPDPDQLQLQRQLWLDFDGAGWTMSDHLSGKLSRSWRLEMPAPLQLGRVAVGATNQPITHLSPQSAPGVEVRQGQLNLFADARLSGAARSLPAVGWDEDVTALNATLHLPPGWRLLAARGVDEVPGTWLRSWSLLELFLVLVVAIVAARLYGRWVGVLALVALVLSVPEPDAPEWTWLAVLVVEALVRVLPEGRLRQVVRGLRLAAFGLLAVFLVQFAVEHLRAAMYPAIGGEPLRAMPSPARTLLVGAQAKSEDGEGGGAVRGAKGDESEAAMAEPEPPSAAPAFAAKRVEPREKTPSSLSSPVTEVDRLAVIQTGPGVPTWQWTAVPLRWNGPVLRTQGLVLYLMSPGLARVFAFLRVLLLALLALAFFDAVKRIRPRLGAAATLTLLAAALLLPGRANAQAEPSDARLEALRERLLAAPRCAPSCVAVSRLLLEADAELLRVRLEVSAAAAGTLVLPGSAQQWLPAQVLLDGQAAPALRREDGRLILVVPPGVHQVLLEGRISGRKALQLALGAVPGYAEARALGWKVDGIHPDGRADDTLQLSRDEEKNGALPGGELRSSAMPAFVRLERHLRFGLTWEVDTEVVRLSAAGSAAVLSVPLIPGEAVNTPDVHVEKRRVLVNLGPEAARTSWHSTLAPLERLTLTAPADGAWVEEWTLEVGTMWHVVLGGIPPLYPTSAGQEHRPTWEPWPGESVDLQFSRPVGAAGQTLTIDSAELSVSPGLRATDASVSLAIRSSRGVQHQVSLPPGAELLQALVGGQSQPLRLEGGRVSLPITPGLSRVQLRWREARSLQPFFAPAVVDLGAPAVNVSTVLHLPTDRWVLLLGGPLVGPSVLFWSFLVVTVLVAVALGRVKLVPISTLSWVLLGVGLTQVPVVAGAVVVACLLAFGWRARYAASIASDRVFNVLQVLLAMLAVVSVFILFMAVRQGLLGEPDMQVHGSSATALTWFQDRTAGPLPRPWVLSVPLLVYRLAMLAWALWLVTALLRWLRWGAAAATSGGFWRRRLVRPTPSPSPPPPPVSIS
jgi:hypothetical protein